MSQKAELLAKNDPISIRHWFGLAQTMPPSPVPTPSGPAAPVGNCPAGPCSRRQESQ
jgi:hypothetical protein